MKAIEKFVNMNVFYQQEKVDEEEEDEDKKTMAFMWHVVGVPLSAKPFKWIISFNLYDSAMK